MRIRRYSQDLVALDDKRRRSLFGPGIEESDISDKSARCVRVPGRAPRVRIGRLAHEGQRLEYLAPPRARFCRRLFGDLVEAVPDSTAQLTDSRRRGTVFVDQPALLGLEVLYRV